MTTFAHFPSTRAGLTLLKFVFVECLWQQTRNLQSKSHLSVCVKTYGTQPENYIFPGIIQKGIPGVKSGNLFPLSRY